MKILFDSLAIAEKELKLNFRYKWAFFISNLLNPLLRAGPFLLVYYGFFAIAGDSVSIGGVSSLSFVVFLLLGMLVDIFLHSGLTVFSDNFLREKFWQTIQGFLLAPTHKLSLVIGVGISQLVAIFPTMLFFLLITFIWQPVSPLVLVFCLLVLAGAFLIALGAGLLLGSAALFNENFVPIFGYLRVIWVFFSCFYYSIDVLKFSVWGVLIDLRLLAELNPIYQAVAIIRATWVYGFDYAFQLWPQFAYFAAFVIIVPLVSVFIFRKLFKRFDIEGY